MEKKSNSNVSIGLSAAIGAAAGVVAGNVIATEVDAKELKDEVETLYEDVKNNFEDDDKDPIMDADIDGKLSTEGAEKEQPVEAVPSEVSNDESSAASTEPIAETSVVSTELEEPDNMEVLAYATVQVDSDDKVDVAVVNANVYLTDEDRDGIADYATLDFNENMQYDEDKLIDLSANNVSMEELKNDLLPEEVAVNDVCMADDVDDYVNDANVDEFEA